MNYSMVCDYRPPSGEGRALGVTAQRLNVRGGLLTAYLAGLTVLSLVLPGLAGWRLRPLGAAVWQPFLALIALALLAEFFAVRDRVTSASSTVSSVPFLAAIVLLGPAYAVAVAAVTKVVAEALFRRHALASVVHASCTEIVAVTVAGLVYFALGGAASTSAFAASVPAFAAAVVAYLVLARGLAAVFRWLGTGLSTGHSRRLAWWRSVTFEVFACFLALFLAFAYVELGLLGVCLVIVPLYFIRHADEVNVRLEQAGRDTLELMVKSIEARDRYTSGHSLRVAAYAKLLARELGLPSREVEQVEHAAMLHDVGKIYEEYTPILRKPGKLTPVEQGVMESHSIKGAELVATVSTLRGYIESCVRNHHEWYDGRGYPDGLAGDAIPLGARIIMVADTVDAMSTERPYRAGLPYGRVVAAVSQGCGTQFDPRVVAAFHRCAALHKRLRDQRPALNLGTRVRWSSRVPPARMLAQRAP